MSHFIFIRHGETAWNVDGKMQGSQDIPLNAKGLEQAVAAAVYLKKFPITKIVSSDLDRAKSTAVPIADAFSLAVHLDPALRERHFGDYEGRVWEEIPRVPVNPNEPGGPFDYPEGKVEPFHELKTRTKTAIERWMQAHKNDLILFVAHGGVFSALIDAYGTGSMRIDNAKPYDFRLQSDGKWICRAL